MTRTEPEHQTVQGQYRALDDFRIGAVTGCTHPRYRTCTGGRYRFCTGPVYLRKGPVRTGLFAAVLRSDAGIRYGSGSGPIYVRYVATTYPVTELCRWSLLAPYRPIGFLYWAGTYWLVCGSVRDQIRPSRTGSVPALYSRYRAGYGPLQIRLTWAARIQQRIKIVIRYKNGKKNNGLFFSFIFLYILY